jgi:hypothetical protein
MKTPVLAFQLLFLNNWSSTAVSGLSQESAAPFLVYSSYYD